MAFHDFDLNISFESNEREFLFDLNQSPTREFTSSNIISTFPIHEDEDYSQMNPGFLLIHACISGLYFETWCTYDVLTYVSFCHALYFQRVYPLL